MSDIPNPTHLNEHSSSLIDLLIVGIKYLVTFFLMELKSLFPLNKYDTTVVGMVSLNFQSLKLCHSLDMYGIMNVVITIYPVIKLQKSTGEHCKAMTSTRMLIIQRLVVNT